MFDELPEPFVVPIAADEVFLAVRKIAMLDDPEVCLSPDTTIQELFSRMSWFEDTREMVSVLQSLFGVRFSKAQWREVLKPAKSRTLGDVCQLVATRATRMKVVPYSILGRDCLPAGAFCLVRSTLKAAGANVATFSPSSPLEPYLRDHTTIFQVDLQRSTLLELPYLKIWHPVFARTGWFVLILAAIIAVCILLLNRGVGLVTLTWVAISCLAAPAIWLIVGSLVPKRFCRYSLGALVTVRDVCVAIAGSEPTKATS